MDAYYCFNILKLHQLIKKDFCTCISLSILIYDYYIVQSFLIKIHNPQMKLNYNISSLSLKKGILQNQIKYLKWNELISRTHSISHPRPFCDPLIVSPTCYRGKGETWSHAAMTLCCLIVAMTLCCLIVVLLLPRLFLFDKYKPTIGVQLYRVCHTCKINQSLIEHEISER